VLEDDDSDVDFDDEVGDVDVDGVITTVGTARGDTCVSLWYTSSLLPTPCDDLEDAPAAVRFACCASL